METQESIVKKTSEFLILPYSQVVGQQQIKLALELAYVAPRIGGVLLSGERGTGKSTAVRAFSQMMYNRLPVTLPINATEDRVVGGWKIKDLMQSRAIPEPGLLEEANGSLLYIDEVNLLDDHIVNIILDVTSTGVLVVQREGQSEQKQVSFTLVGTMNPEEGGLRPQLLDRFGLMVSVEAEKNETSRLNILKAVLDFDRAFSQTGESEWSDYIDKAKEENRKHKELLKAAKQNFYSVEIPDKILSKCVQLAKEFKTEGNRGDYMVALAARACAALQGDSQVMEDHVAKVAQLALQHRRNPEFVQNREMLWTQEDKDLVDAILKGYK
ncbi:magnesium-chelatase, subunit I [Kalymmatonema gypsitolerans NIES-4073]|nr:magnesium-chelatase, subunit I [Scytonema sp. NIES-4073]